MKPNSLISLAFALFYPAIKKALGYPGIVIPAKAGIQRIYWAPRLRGSDGIMGPG